MATRAPLRDSERSRVEPTHGLLDRAEEWAEETGLAPEGEPAAGVPWHAVVLIVAGSRTRGRSPGRPVFSE